MRTLAILPVKRFELAKTRLHDQLAPQQRRRLAAAMVADVLDMLVETPGLDAVVVTLSLIHICQLLAGRSDRRPRLGAAR